MQITPQESNKLQAAFEESGRTGEPVELCGVFGNLNTPLTTQGATILGRHGSHHGNWNIGGTVLHFKNGAYLRVTNGPTGNATVIKNLATVFYHQATPEAPGIVMDASAYGAVLENVLIDRAGRALVFEPSIPTAPRSLGHRFHEMRFNSFRSAAIYCPSPSRTSDHYFSGLTYLNGLQGGDYVASPVIPTTRPTGIFGWPNSTHFDYLLIESCSVAAELFDLICATAAKIKVDNHFGTVFKCGTPYPGTQYDRSLRIGIFSAVAYGPKCQLSSGGKRIPIDFGLSSVTAVKPGSWVNAITPMRSN